MKRGLTTSLLLACTLIILITGCKDAPGNPRLLPDAARPDQVLDFATLYKQNCSACHGERGQNGASISLANPVYLAVAGESNIEHTVAAGVPGTLMPAFSKTAGGMLTDQQIAAVAHGIVAGWGNPQTFGGATMPAYANDDAKGDAATGCKTFATFCARCHGADGTGGAIVKGSIVDPAYLALVSDQFLRSTIIAGKPENGMPDWRSHANGEIMSEQEITDTVAWLDNHRTATPGQPYQTQQAPSGAKHE